MTKVSKLAAFVFENGALASEILFRDLSEEEELPGITDDERVAMSAIEETMDQVWIDILSACRTAFLALAEGHPCAKTLRMSPTRPSTMAKNSRVAFPLMPGSKATCGFTLDVWDDKQFGLHIWVWAQARFRPTMVEALEDVEQQLNDDGEGSLHRTLFTPAEGQSYEEIAKQAAAELWLVAQPVAEALRA